MMKGIAASKGIAVGKAYPVGDTPVIIKGDKQKYDPAAEINSFYDAKNLAANAIAEAMAILAPDSPEAELLSAHEMMLLDEELSDRIVSLIKEKTCSASYAVDLVMEEYARMFEEMDDEYLRARAADCRDIKNQLLSALAGENALASLDIPDGAIVVAMDLLASQLLSFPKQRLSGLVIGKGSTSSHVAILARGWGIPVVVGAHDAVSFIRENDRIILDGGSGEILINPSLEEEKLWTNRIKEQEARRAELLKLISISTVTKGGRHIPLLANVGNMTDIDAAVENGAEGIGLFRTEFLYMDLESPPSEAEQYEIYLRASQAFPGKPVIIRTLDAGGDKGIDYLNVPSEENPFLGYRAIRLCLGRPELFKTQLRAILRASVLGNVKIMFPMIASADELRKAKELLNEVKNELRSAGTGFDESIQVGIMVETPSAAIISDLLADEADFFSIGTNDLTQYTMAADRTNPAVQYLSDPFAPAVLRLIKTTIENAHKNKIHAGLCGEAGASPEMIRYLLEYGIDDISMAPASILEARDFIINY